MMEDPKNHEHWTGWKNKAIRYYFYVNTGLNVFNNFKYLVGAILALYWMLHMKNPALLLIMFGISIPALGLLGYYSIHHINKVMDWLGIRFGSYYSIQQFEIFKEIRDGINKMVRDRGKDGN